MDIGRAKRLFENKRLLENKCFDGRASLRRASLPRLLLPRLLLPRLLLPSLLLPRFLLPRFLLPIFLLPRLLLAIVAAVIGCFAGHALAQEPGGYPAPGRTAHIIVPHGLGTG